MTTTTQEQTHAIGTLDRATDAADDSGAVAAVLRPAEGTRVTGLSNALDAMQAMHGEYARHLEACESAQGGHWCQQCYDLDWLADASASAYQRELDRLALAEFAS